MTTDDQKLARRRRNLKCLAYIVAGVIAQTAIIVVFVLFVMRIRSPKVGIGAVTVENLTVNNSASLPSFSMNLNAQVNVKNTNFGHFKFENSTAKILYQGVDVGEGTIVKARARSRSTKRVNVTVAVNSSKVTSSSNLGSDLDAGVLTFNSQAKVDGRVILFKIFKRKKTVEMNCTMVVRTATPIHEIQNLICK